MVPLAIFIRESSLLSSGFVPGKCRSRSSYAESEIARWVPLALPRLYSPRLDRDIDRDRTCSKVHCSGLFSGRQRRNRVPCRKRSPEKWSKRTSQTRAGRSGSHSVDRPWLQRLGAPGRLPGEAGSLAGGERDGPKLLPLLGGEAGGETDVIEPPRGVVEAEQER